MPTKRSWILLTFAAALYFLANQTQVGWLYIMVDSIIGLLLISFLYSRGMLKPIRVRRSFSNQSPRPSTPARRSAPRSRQSIVEGTPASFYEDDALEVALQFRHDSVRPAFMIQGNETCPFAPPADQAQPFFIPALFRGQPVELRYRTHCDRRGLYQFSMMRITSKGPFGLFTVKRTLTAPGDLLVYPSYHPLKRLRLLEHRGFSEKQAQRVGVSSEVLGTREYRSGDSLRQIHWRSTARTGRLVAKEFTDQNQLTLTVLLDLAVPSKRGHGKFSPFETAIRLAASFGYYAERRNIPFYLMGSSPNWRPPQMPLSWEATLNYLARVENDGPEPLADLVRRLPALPFVIVLVSHPAPAIVRALASLARRGVQTLAIVIVSDDDPAPLPSRERAPNLTVRSVGARHWREGLADL